MSSLSRNIAIGFILALVWTMVPASISPTGSIEVDTLCASGACQRTAGAFCLDGGDVLWGYRNVIG